MDAAGSTYLVGVTVTSARSEAWFRRRTDDKTPVVLMGYANPIEALGYEVFARQAKDAGVDGVALSAVALVDDDDRER